MTELEITANEIRKDIVRMIAEAGSGHPAALEPDPGDHRLFRIDLSAAVHHESGDSGSPGTG